MTSASAPVPVDPVQERDPAGSGDPVGSGGPAGRGPARRDPSAGRGPALDVAGLGVGRAFGFVSPAMLLIGAFLVFPALWTIYIGVTNYRLTGVEAVSPSFVGLSNYTKALNDALFHNALWLTMLFVLGSAIIGQNILGFTLAWVMRRTRPAVRRTVEAFVLLAWILPSTVVAYLWVAFFDRDGGTLNSILGTPGTAWLIDYPMACLVIFNTWRGTAFSMMLYSSALQAVPPSQLESARMVGASGWQTLRDVVFPHIRGHVLTNTLLISLWTANDFSPFLLTKGGPNHESETVPVYIYNVALQGGELGYSSAISFLLLIANLLVSLIYLRLLRRRS
ncbi:multiple sugar transport system permease protein [Kribbella steppae]|uniref:Multiple sugar transport system permease protein n=1 Tax=Kribbella steppae TaxID=2512223 RepID=A0A4R2H2Y0_9ACTN|nr:sugar ABC transporter permease [Kribbella steppae]TCO17695.1 multiple sugar transport system permease protein [Kribbella steppae]